MSRIPIPITGRASWRPRHIPQFRSRPRHLSNSAPRSKSTIQQRSYRTSTTRWSSPSHPLSQIHTLIPPGSLHHSSLSSFLAHARRTSLTTSSPLFIGTLFEYHVLASLKALGFNLQRVGRTSDNGIDLLGTWTVPSHHIPIRVLLQCKNHARALNPEHIRELEGAFGGAPAGWRRPAKSKSRGGSYSIEDGENNVMGFLVSPRQASKGVREAVARSRLPVGYIMVDGVGLDGTHDQLFEEPTLMGGGESGGKVRQFLWNKEAQERGLEGLGVTTRYSPTSDMSGLSTSTNTMPAEMDKEVVLTWNGWAINRLADQPDVQVSNGQGNLELSTPTSITKAVDEVETAGITTSLGDLSISEEVVPAPKKRGRPRKDASLNESTTMEKSKAKSTKKKA